MPPACWDAPMRFRATWCMAANWGASCGFRTLNLRFRHWKPAASGIFVVLVHGLANKPLPRRGQSGRLRPSLDADDVNGGRRAAGNPLPGLAGTPWAPRGPTVNSIRVGTAAQAARRAQSTVWRPDELEALAHRRHARACEDARVWLAHPRAPPFATISMTRTSLAAGGSLNLPDTPFPMRGDLPKRNAAWAKTGSQQGLYQKLRDARQCAAVRAARRPALRQRQAAHRPCAQQGARRT